MNDDNTIRFDWAIKRILRHKADHTILNGFLSSLLEQPVKIVRMLESESNQEDEENKSNRVDMLAEVADGKKIIIEVQNETEDSYFHRMLFGVSKIVSQYLKKGEKYDKISKVYSINIVYFKLGEGSDWAYHGTTEFRGMHNHELLQLPPILQDKYKVQTVNDIFPEYYILRVNDFNEYAVSPLEQWLHFLRHSELPEKANAPGLREASEELKYSKLSPEEKRAYDRYIDNMLSLEDAMESAWGKGLYEGRIKGREEGLAKGREEGLAKGREEGLAKGREEGLAKGREEEKWINAKNFYKLGIPLEIISQATGISMDKLKDLLL